MLRRVAGLAMIVFFATWVSAGATFLHIVDLDGARDGRPVNGASIRQIVQAAGVPCQLGGGLRTEADLETTEESDDINEREKLVAMSCSCRPGD